MSAEAYLRSVLSPLLEHEPSLSVSESQDDMGVLLSISLAKEDMGRIIGKAGETAKALRLLVRVWGMQHKQRISIKILEPVI